MGQDVVLVLRPEMARLSRVVVLVRSLPKWNMSFGKGRGVRRCREARCVKCAIVGWLRGKEDMVSAVDVVVGVVSGVW